MAYSKSFSLLSLAIFGAILLSQGLVEARGKHGVNPFCRRATSFGLCNIMVNGAKTHQEAAINAIQSTRALASRIPSLAAAVTNIINTDITTTPEAKADVQKTCTDVFQNTVDDLDTSLAAINGEDFFSAAVHLSAIKFDECSAALEEFGVILPMKKIVTLFERQVSNTLAVVNLA